MNPFSTLQLIAGGYCLPRCLHVVADFGVADALGEDPMTAAELAVVVGADPDALGRVLRLLSTLGVFESRNGKFLHSPASRLLRADHPQSMRPFVRMFGVRFNWDTYAELEHSVRTGQPAGDKVTPGGFWAYFSDRPEEWSIFNEAMEAKAHGQVAAIVGAYDFSGFRVISDIGGGRGHLLRAVLERSPAARGVLFDLPRVIDESKSLASDRLTLQAGDFFKDELPACDAYLLMDIIHDWNDEESEEILKAIRRAAQPNAKLLLLETIVPENDMLDWSKMLDVHMLTLLGGKQRTRQEFEAMLDKAGFTFEREIDTGAGISIIEAAAQQRHAT